jgi:hypothetical protein
MPTLDDVDHQLKALRAKFPAIYAESRRFVGVGPIRDIGAMKTAQAKLNAWTAEHLRLVQAKLDAYASSHGRSPSAR